MGPGPAGAEVPASIGPPLGEEAMNRGLWMLVTLQQRMCAPKRTTYISSGRQLLGTFESLHLGPSILYKMRC